MMPRAGIGTCVALLFVLVTSLSAQDAITPDLRAAMDAAAPGQRVAACLVMADQFPVAELDRRVHGLHGRPRRVAVALALLEHSMQSLSQVSAALAAARTAGRAGDSFSLWMGNAVLFEAEPIVVEALAALPGVDRIESVVALPPEAVEDVAAAPPPAATGYPFHEDFEVGVLSDEWTVETTGAGQVTVTASEGPLDNYHCVMDSAVDNMDGTGSMTVALDLTGQVDVGIRFEHKEFSDDDDDEDGVFVSDDGVNWTKAESLNGAGLTYALNYIDLDPIVSAAGLTYGHNFRVRFQWRDNFGVPIDGFAFDNIDIAPGVGSPDLPPPEANLVALQAPKLWALGHDGAGVLIGTIDSGVWITHPDLVNRIWSNPSEIPANGLDDDVDGFIDDVHGWNFVTHDGDVLSGDPHGTNTAGIVCGDGSSGVKLTGMAPGAKLVCLAVNSEAEYWAAQQYCLKVGVDCITSSFSYKWANNPKPDYHMHRQLCSIELVAGIAHANSIGNQGALSGYPIPFNIATPGNCPSPFAHPALADGGRGSVIAVGGIELPNDALYANSGRGPAAWEDLALYIATYQWPQNPAFWDYPYGGFFFPTSPGLVKPDVVAYTTNIQTTTIGTGYVGFGGTSAATPHVGGALALLLSSQPEAEPRHLTAALELTAVDLGVPGKDNIYGSGKIQVYDAARRLVVLGRAGDQAPPLGSSVTFDIFAPPTATVAWLVSLSISDVSSNFNLDPPFFLLASLPIGASGHLAVPLAIPAIPTLAGLTVWSQFTAKGVAAEWGPARFWSVPEDITPQ